MKEILLINLTRMGDLLQTTPLLAGLKEENPASTITLLVNSAFAEICNGIPFIDELIEFDITAYKKRLVGGKNTLVENFRYLENIINRINEKEYDLTINITHSPVSALLTSCIRSKEIRGFSTDSEGHRVIRHPWMRYFFNVIPNRLFNPYHLVDMYLKIGEVKPKTRRLVYDLSAADDAAADRLLKEKGLMDSDILIGIHLGASKSDKTWPVPSYAELADLITAEYKAKIALFGSPQEADLAHQFEMTAKYAPLNFVGQTNLPLLAGLLKKCGLFVSNDTGPMHIATAVGTKVIDISAANVHFMETGPYGEGHYVVQADLPCVPCGFDVQCTNMICKEVITPALIIEVVRKALNEGDQPLDAHVAKNMGVQVYLSHFKEDGYLGFTPLTPTPVSKEAVYRVFYRYIWNRESMPLKCDDYDSRENLYRELSDHDMTEWHKISSSLESDLGAISQLLDLSVQGLRFVSSIGEEAAREPVDVKKIKKIWLETEKIDAEIERIGNTFPCFKPLTLMFLYGKEAMEGNDLLSLSDESRRIYRDLAEKAEEMRDLMIRAKDRLADKSEHPCDVMAR